MGLSLGMSLESGFLVWKAIAVQGSGHAVHTQRTPWNSQQQECFGMLEKAETVCPLHTFRKIKVRRTWCTSYESL